MSSNAARPNFGTRPNLTVDGLQFRDLDHDGVLAPYEDWRLPPAVRTADLVSRMTLNEKIGLLLHGTATAVGGPMAIAGRGTGYDTEALEVLVNGVGVNSLISRLSLPPDELAAQNNLLQFIAERGRLGIPLTISTDPRNHFSVVDGASVSANGFSQWPEMLGLAAIGDPELVSRFADIVRQEYRAVGFHLALSPQADLATSPRWPRTVGTFGDDPKLVRLLVGAYVEGMQAGRGGLGPASVAVCVKHFVGYGASRDGFDGHNYYGRYSAFPAGRFQDHVEAFLDAFKYKVASVMPTYTILDGLVLDGKELEAVGGGYSTDLLQDLLLGKCGFDGVVLSDWMIARDLTESARTGVPRQTPADIAMPWGVEGLTRSERFAKGLNAGLDQFGGETDPAPLIDAFERGTITIERINQSASKILLQKFELGLFEAPFVDESGAAQVVGNPGFTMAASEAQRLSVTRIKKSSRSRTNGSNDSAGNPIVFCVGIAQEALVAAGIEVTDQLDQANLAIIALSTPKQLLHPGHFFASMQNEGDLDFKEGDRTLAELERLSSKVPTIVVVQLDRPAILTNIVDKASELYGVYGAGDESIVDAIFGPTESVGRLPFALLRSMADVMTHPCDQPYEPTGDSVNPALFPRGFRA